MATVTALLVPISLLPFLPFVARARPLARALLPVSVAVEELRSINAYHLFAQMTLVRREPVIEGSDDGVTWLSYELHYEPGDVDRAPPFVAPHQPRVDFQIWFLLLGARPRAAGSRRCSIACDTIRPRSHRSSRAIRSPARRRATCGSRSTATASRMPRRGHARARGGRATWKASRVPSANDNASPCSETMDRAGRRGGGACRAGARTCSDRSGRSALVRR